MVCVCVCVCVCLNLLTVCVCACMCVCVYQRDTEPWSLLVSIKFLGLVGFFFGHVKLRVKLSDQVL